MAERATIQCPQCGSPVPVDRRFSHMAVCGACRSVVTFGEGAARVAGRMSVLPAARSRLWVGGTGAVKGRRFTAIGRVRYGWSRGFWDEWLLAGDDGEPIWLSEDEGELSLERPLDGAPDVDVASLEPGASVTAGGRSWRVTERGVARCEGGEGQLPFAAVEGEDVPFVDLEGPDRSVATLERDEEGPRLFAGEILRPGELRLDQEREAEGFAEDLPVARKAAGDAPERLTQLSGAVRAVSCASCGGGMEVDSKGGVPDRVRCPYCDHVEELGPRSVTCPSCAAPVPVRSGEAGVATCVCGALISLRSSVPTVLARLAQARPRPPIPLGSSVTLRGVTWEATGWAQYEGQSGGETFRWDEILLFSEQAGHAWLELSDGHASLGVKVVSGPDAGSPVDALTWKDERWTLAEQCTARILWVEGELPWVAMVGDRVRTAEYARPPYMLSAEWASRGESSEVEWTLAEYLPQPELRAAVADPSRLPRPEGVAPHQPYPRAAGQILVASAVALVVAIALLVWTLGAGVQTATFAFDEAYDEPEQSDTFVVSRDDVTLEVVFETPSLDNQWVYLRAALLDEEGGVVSEWSSQLSHFHGVEDGESWTEGNLSDNALLRVEKAGTYRIGVEAEAGHGDQEDPDPTFEPPIQARVLEGAMTAEWAGLFLAAAAALFIALGVHRLNFVRKRKGDDDDDD